MGDHRRPPAQHHVPAEQPDHPVVALEQGRHRVAGVTGRGDDRQRRPGHLQPIAVRQTGHSDPELGISRPYAAPGPLRQGRRGFGMITVPVGQHHGGDPTRRGCHDRVQVLGQQRPRVDHDHRAPDRVADEPGVGPLQRHRSGVGRAEQSQVGRLGHERPPTPHRIPELPAVGSLHHLRHHPLDHPLGRGLPDRGQRAQLRQLQQDRQRRRHQGDLAGPLGGQRRVRRRPARPIGLAGSVLGVLAIRQLGQEEVGVVAPRLDLRGHPVRPGQQRRRVQAYAGLLLGLPDRAAPDRVVGRPVGGVETATGKDHHRRGERHPGVPVQQVGLHGRPGGPQQHNAGRWSAGLRRPIRGPGRRALGHPVGHPRRQPGEHVQGVRRHRRPVQTGWISGVEPTATTSSTSTGASSGRLATPTALRACRPARPKISPSRSLAPLATCGCPVNPGALDT